MQHIKQLLSKMTTAEKSFFSLLYKDSKDSTFYQVYEYLLKNKEADIEKLIKRFPNASQPHYELSKLYKRLLKALIVFKFNSKQPQKKIQYQLLEIEVLLEKNRIVSAFKKLRKVKKEAQENELYLEMLRCLEFERTLASLDVKSDRIKEIARIIEETDTTVKRLQEFLAFRLAIEACIELEYKHTYVVPPEEIPEFLLNNPVLSEGYKPSSSRIQYAHYMLLGIWFGLLGDIKKSNFYRLKNLLYAQEHPHLFSDVQIIVCYNNLLFGHFMARNGRQFEEVRENMISEYGTHPYHSDTVKYYAGPASIEMALRTADSAKISARISECLSFYHSTKSRLTQTKIDNILFSTIYGYLMTKQPRKANDLLIEWHKTKIGDFILMDSIVLSICVHYRMKYFFLLGNQLKRLKRLYRLSETKNPALELFIEFVFKLTKSGANQKELTQNYLSQFKKLHGEKNNWKYFLKFHYLDWFQALVEGTKSSSSQN